MIRVPDIPRATPEYPGTPKAHAAGSLYYEGVTPAKVAADSAWGNG